MIARGLLDDVLRELKSVTAALADEPDGGVSLLDVRERLLGCVSMLEDVASGARDVGVEARQALELEQDEQRALLESVIEQLPSGVAIVDATDGTLLMANAEAVDIARERFDEPDGLERLVRGIASGVRTAEVVEVERRDGSRGALELSAAPIRDAEGNVTARVAVFQDVTQRERLERAEREFVTNAAHELQTPLTAITSAAEVLQAGAKEVPADRDRFLAHIQSECDRLARLVRALLVLARAETQGTIAAAERLRLRPVLETVAAAVRPADGVTVAVSCPPRLSASVNRDLAEQAVASLAANAAKYTSSGSIRLAASRVDPDQVAIEVSDTGPGISPEEVGLVRQRFFRGGNRDRTGFGLGLAIAEQAARALGGRLELEQAPGGGTTARLVVPRAGGTR